MSLQRVYCLTLALLCYVWQTYGDSSCNLCEVVVQLDSGPICGSVRRAENATDYYSFRGVPYAKPPTGARRFAELEACDPWEDVLLTVEERPVCPQLDDLYGSIPARAHGMDEDCIYASVHVPSGAKLNLTEDDDSGLPILVNIHGGAYQSGSGDADLHGPEYLMYKGDMIVMSFNYRLAAIGFLSLGSDKIPGNNGLRDMYTFLNWVQRNGRSFGGNPKNITLIGQSVGSTSVHLLTLSTATNKLFQRGIMLSGSAIPYYYSASPAYAQYLATIFLEAAGITSTDPDVIHEQLIEMSLEDIMYANSVVQNLTGVIGFGPVVESDHANFIKILDDEPITLIGEGRGKDIPLILGFTNNEGATFSRALNHKDVLDRLRQSSQVVLPLSLAFSLNTTDATEAADKVVQRYFNESFSLDSIEKCFRDAYFAYPSFKMAQWRAAIGGAPAYLYEYGYESTFSTVKRGLWLKYDGAGHADDIPTIFRTNTFLGDQVSFPPTTTDDHMKDWMTSMVINFTKCNNPTCIDDASSPWPPVVHNRLQMQSIVEPKVYNMVELSDYYKSMVNFYDSIDPNTRSLSERLNVTSLE